MIALAKRIEEIFIPGRRAPLVLDHSTPELQLLQRVRDEAHRFAITHHRSRRDKAMTSSVLDELPGIGPARKRALLRHFGSTEAVLAASREAAAERARACRRRSAASCTAACAVPARIPTRGPSGAGDGHGRLRPASAGDATISSRWP